MVNRARRLLSKLRPGAGWLKHQAWVSPARNKDKKAIPANAVDECPDGNDRRPSIMSLALLYMRGQHPARTEEKDSSPYPVQACSSSLQRHRVKKSGRSLPEEASKRSLNQSIVSLHTHLLCSSKPLLSVH